MQGSSSRQASTELSFRRVAHGPLLRESYRLRYDVYCRHRRFLPPERYPTGIETDAFDAHAMHFVAVNIDGQLEGTVRLVLDSKEGLPCEGYLPDQQNGRLFGVPRLRLAEVSRLAVRPSTRESAVDQMRPLDVAIGLYREVYRASRDVGVSHLLAAMERSLERLLARLAFPFEAVGPQIDYYGAVRPYLLDLDEFDEKVARDRPGTFAYFTEGNGLAFGYANAIARRSAA